jgi:hypothetical protein
MAARDRISAKQDFILENQSCYVTTSDWFIIFGFGIQSGSKMKIENSYSIDIVK